MDHASLLKQFEHLDPHNQNTFEAKDLELLISTVRSSRGKPTAVFLGGTDLVSAEPEGASSPPSTFQQNHDGSAQTEAVSGCVQATKDLENYDAERHEEFKRYEMLKEHERREYLKSLDQEKREREEKRLQELKEKHSQHPKVNAPVGTHTPGLLLKVINMVYFCRRWSYALYKVKIY